MGRSPSLLKLEISFDTESKFVIVYVSLGGVLHLILLKLVLVRVLLFSYIGVV